ncbi:MAG: large-conductance mechanosensitive channel protein MscL [Eubacteriales bacterium]
MKKSTFFADFRKFIAKGNVVDMAVGVVIGGAFGKIVTALVNDVIMPLVGLLTGGLSISDRKWVMTEAVLDEAGNVLKPENALAYGDLIQTIVDFLIVALCIFAVLRIFMKLKEKAEKKKDAVEEEKKEELPPPETAEDILKDIRELLKK